MNSATTSNHPTASLPARPALPVKLDLVDQAIVQRFDAAIGDANGIETLLEAIGEIVADQSDCLAFWVCPLQQNDSPAKPRLIVGDQDNSVWPVVQSLVPPMLEHASQTRKICSSTLSTATPTELVVAPICPELTSSSSVSVQPTNAAAAVPFVLIGCFSCVEQAPLRQQWLLGMATQAFTRWLQVRQLKQQTLKNKSLNDTIGLVHELDKTSSVSEASVVIVNYLRRICHADQVALSLCSSSSQGALAAVSDVEQVDLSAESNRLINNASRQAILERAPVHFPANEPTNTPGQLALEKYCKSNAFESCWNIPLSTHDGQLLGAVLIGGNQLKLADEEFREYLSKVLQMVSGHVDVVVRANRSTTERLSERWREFRQTKLFKYGLIASIICCGAMAIPLPYRVACECELQPVLRRFIAAPYDGILEKSFVKSGDLVAADEVVAHLDGRQLRIELSGLKAELDGAKKRRESTLAQGDIAQSQIAKSEMQRLGSKIAILQQQLGNLEVRSPIEGIVVAGDLEKAEGAPLQMGQTLFEIGPLDKMLAEIHIPESEIQYAQAGMPVAIKLNAFPFRTFAGEIEQIHPRAEIVNDESVFVAQVSLRNDDKSLRPGMQGAAKIRSEFAPIGWILFHRPWETIRYWTIW